MTKNKVAKKKNSYLKMIGWMAIGGVIGGIIGFSSLWGWRNGLSAMLAGISAWIGANIVLLLVFFLLSAVWLSVICYQKGETFVRRYQNSQDDEEQDKLDRSYDIWTSIGVTGTSLIIYLSIALFAFCTNIEEMEDMGAVSGMFVAAALLIVIALVCTFYQIAMVKQVRRKDPLKRGDASDMNFQKVWIASCDEAEKRVIYEASYKTFSVTRTILLVATVMALIGQTHYGSGIMAVVLLTGCNILLTLIYTYYSMKLDKTKLDM